VGPCQEELRHTLHSRQEASIIDFEDAAQPSFEKKGTKGNDRCSGRQQNRKLSPGQKTGYGNSGSQVEQVAARIGEGSRDSAQAAST
jgi:hypothetical protein